MVLLASLVWQKILETHVNSRLDSELNDTTELLLNTLDSEGITELLLNTLLELNTLDDESTLELGAAEELEGSIVIAPDCWLADQARATVRSPTSVALPSLEKENLWMTLLGPLPPDA